MIPGSGRSPGEGNGYPLQYSGLENSMDCIVHGVSRSKYLLIAWLQLPYAMILEYKKIKFVTVSIVSPSVCHEVMGLDAMILVFFEC